MSKDPLHHLSGRRIILGSGSPRRRELLKGLGLSFSIHVSNVPEDVPENISIVETAAYLSLLKSDALIDLLNPSDILITADTIVTFDNQILNKPESEVEGIIMLQKLQGRIHKVITGVTIATLDRQITFSDSSEVHIQKMKPEEIKYYIDECNPLDKAGSYGIQDWYGLTMIHKLVGSYYTVMGLPTHLVYKALRDEFN